MREFIVENLVNTVTVDVATIVLNNIVAMAAAFFIMFTYKLTYSGTAYSRKFNLTLGTISIVTTMIMSVISNNIALSLGMVGALSIIRYRTAIKDVRDASYIFWAIAVGIGCGVSQYALIGIGSIFLFLFMLFTKQAVLDKRQLLIVQGTLDSQNEIESIVEEHFSGQVTQVMKNVTPEECEVIFTVKEGVLTKANQKNQIDISQRLMKIEGMKRVNLVEQSDDISR